MKAISLLFLISAVIVGAGCSRDREAPKTTAAVEPDNTGRNVRDRNDATKTAEDQSENEADRTITQNIRKAIAGPIMAALAGAGVGAAVGGLSGALIGMGIPELEAKQYEGKIKSGNILISVHSEDSTETSRAKEIFERHSAHDISSTGEESIPSKDKRPSSGY